MGEQENKHECIGSRINEYPGNRACLYRYTILHESKYYARYDENLELDLTVFI